MIYWENKFKSYCCNYILLLLFMFRFILKINVTESVESIWSLWQRNQLPTVKDFDGKWNCSFLTGSLLSCVNFFPCHFLSVCRPPLVPSVCRSVCVKTFCFSIWILSGCDHEDGCFWLSNKNRCMVPDRNYKLLSTNTEYVPFPTRGWLEYISLQQSDTKENKKICHRVMAEITVLRFNEKWRHNLAIYSSMSWYRRRAPWVVLSVHAQEYIVASVVQAARVNIWSLMACLFSLRYTQINKTL